MKAVILAAGSGSRIRSLTLGSPKCLLKFGERTILDYQLDALSSVGVRETAIVVGYRSAEIIRHVEGRPDSSGEAVRFIQNDRFSSTNNMYSLSKAQRWLAGEAFLCLNADVLFHADLLRAALRVREGALVIVDQEYHDETTKVIVRDGWVQALDKKLSREEASGTFANIAAFSPSGAAALFAKAAELFEQGEKNQFFNDVLNLLIAEGLPVRSADSDGAPWMEIDDPRDFAYAQRHVFPHLDAKPAERAVLSSVA